MNYVVSSKLSRLANRNNHSYIPTFTPRSGLTLTLPGGSHHTKMPQRKWMACNDDLSRGRSEPAKHRVTSGHAFPTPLHPSYPERRHRGQVHFRGAGYYLVSRQDACENKVFQQGMVAQSCSPSKEAQSSSSSAGLRRYGIPADGCKAPIHSHWTMRSFIHPLTTPHSLVHSGETEG